MHDSIQKLWRKVLVGKLKDRYGLTEEEARTKAEDWLRWVAQADSPTLSKKGADVAGRHFASRSVGH